MAGTREDATLIVELAKWGAMIGLPREPEDLLRRLRPSQRRYARRGGLDDARVARAIGTLVKNRLLDLDLVYDWLWVVGSWDRVGPAARAAREKTGVPELFENFEVLAQGQS